MAVISGTDYQNIATQYATARELLLKVSEYLFEAVYQVVLLNEIVPEVDLLQEFYDSYLVNADLYKSPVTLLSAVRTINNHILNRSSFSDIDDYFVSEGITVPRDWANLTSATGVSIDESNISG